jgi:2-polyprenyl-3-methyl-5-hydroxy-6-metoxy-1,4-benzoquinol methylase
MEKATISRDREKLKRFYKSSSDYKKLLDAHNREYLSTYVDVVNKYAKPKSKILDLGSGSGLSSAMLSEYGHQVIGTDISSFFLSDSTHLQNERLKYLVCDVLELPFDDEAFDVVCSNELIEHVTDAEKAILEMIRMLKNGGLLAIEGPNLCSPFWAMLDFFNILRGEKSGYMWSETAIQALVRGFGNFFISLRKWVSPKPKFIYRTPELEKASDGGDSDSAYYASPIDIERFLKSNGMKIVKLCASVSLRGRIIGRLFPRFGPYISIIAKKE